MTQVYYYRLPLRTPDAHACSPRDLSSSKHLTIIHDQHLQVKRFRGAECDRGACCQEQRPPGHDVSCWRFGTQCSAVSGWLSSLKNSLPVLFGFCLLLGRLQTGFSIGKAKRCSKNQPQNHHLIAYARQKLSPDR